MGPPPWMCLRDLEGLKLSLWSFATSAFALHIQRLTNKRLGVTEINQVQVSEPLHSLSHLLGSSIRYCLVTSSSLINHSYFALTSAILCWRCSKIFSLALKQITSCTMGDRKGKKKSRRRNENSRLFYFPQPSYLPVIVKIQKTKWSHVELISKKDFFWQKWDCWAVLFPVT